MSDPAALRRVLVTGSSRGIGRAIALELAASGFEVAINYRSRSAEAEAVASEIESAGGRARLLPFDVADREAVAAALAADVEAFGPFWGVVLSAGVTADAPLAQMDGEAWDRVLNTNLGGFYNVLQPLVMPMVRLRDGGRVVALSSVAGCVGIAGQTNYGASKAGLIGAVRALSKELAKRKITVNAVAPGFIATEMLAGLETQELAAQVPMRRLGEPEEVAGLVGYLCSERAGYVTGQTFVIDGGMT
jgi:3-oxoacyl-[acyl-carrier protein] reductase